MNDINVVVRLLPIVATVANLIVEGETRGDFATSGTVDEIDAVWVGADWFGGSWIDGTCGCTCAAVTSWI
jgi:hypothetical protein